MLDTFCLVYRFTCHWQVASNNYKLSNSKQAVVQQIISMNWQTHEVSTEIDVRWQSAGVILWALSYLTRRAQNLLIVFKQMHSKSINSESEL